MGKRRNPDGTDATGAITSATSRGYTDHEMIDSVGLVNMNGRIQDPAVGNFLSADPIVQDVYNGKSLNRYSYVWNNPLSYTDPSGFCSTISNVCIENGSGGGGFHYRACRCTTYTAYGSFNGVFFGSGTFTAGGLDFEFDSSGIRLVGPSLNPQAIRRVVGVEGGLPAIPPPTGLPNIDVYAVPTALSDSYFAGFFVRSSFANAATIGSVGLGSASSHHVGENEDGIDEIVVTARDDRGSAFPAWKLAAGSAFIAADLATPDPSDVVWQKWGAYGIFAAAVVGKTTYDELTKGNEAVHANSHLSKRPTEVYHLVNKSSGEIDKSDVPALRRQIHTSLFGSRKREVRYGAPLSITLSRQNTRKH